MKESNKNGHFTPENGHEIKCGDINKTNDSTIALDVLECEGCGEKHVEASAATSLVMILATTLSAAYTLNQFDSTAGILLTGIVIMGGAFVTQRSLHGVTLSESDQR